jgi:hypothetical protein
MNLRKRFYLVSCCCAFLTKSILAYQEPGLCDVAKYVSTEYALPAISPAKANVSKVKNSVCLVKIVQTVNGVTYTTTQSGVLFDDHLIVTAMHGFLPNDAEPLSQPIPVTDHNKVQVCFGYFNGTLPSAGWVNINAMDPSPDKPLLCPQSGKPPYPEKDFIVLECLQVPALASKAKVHIPFDKDYMKQQAPTPFFLAHPSGLPMHVSYDNSEHNKISVCPGGYSCLSTRYSGWHGSSGGGLFWSADGSTDPKCGDLLGIVCGTSDSKGTYNGTDLPRAHLTFGPTMASVFNKDIGATNLLTQYQYQLTDVISPEDYNLIWGYAGAPAANIPSPYKYELNHTTQQAYVWYVYGNDAVEKTQVFELANMLPGGNAPVGHYEIYMEMKKSTSCTNRGTMVESSDPCMDLYNSGGITQVFYDRFDGTSLSSQAIKLHNNIDISDAEFASMSSVGPSVYCSDVLKFDLGDIYYDGATYNGKVSIFAKVKAKLRWQSGYQDIVQGLSIHSIKAVYKDGVTAPIPPTPAPPANIDGGRVGVAIHSDGNVYSDGKAYAEDVYRLHFSAPAQDLCTYKINFGDNCVYGPYSWQGDGFARQYHTYSNPGKYLITVTIQYKCGFLHWCYDECSQVTQKWYTSPNYAPTFEYSSVSSGVCLGISSNYSQGPSPDGSQLTIVGKANFASSTTQDNLVYSYGNKNSGFVANVRVDNIASNGGIMLRQSLVSGSPMVYLYYSSSGKATVEYRTSLGVSRCVAPTTLAGSKPMYLRVKRYGSVVRAYASNDGNAYTELAKLTLSSGALFVGLAQSAPVNIIGSATFANYTVKNYDPMTPIFNLLLGD